MMFSISRFSCQGSRAPLCESISWTALVSLLSEPRRSECTQATCPRSSCVYKRGACWSPVLYVGGDRHRHNVEAITLLVFNVDKVTDDQIDEIRGRIGDLQYLSHSTHSDRPDSRCLRFVFPLSRAVSSEAWSCFWCAAQSHLVPFADPTCADVTRVYFLPSCSYDAGYFIQVNEGSLLDVDSVLATAPLAGALR
jgi:putative DNA primase/helicase